MGSINNFDVIIIGGGVSGCACAWNCAKLGLKTLLVEKKSYLGGAITGGMVIPIMKTDDKNINVDFYNELLKISNEFDAQITYSDFNKGWFNPELMKIVLDKMLTDAGVELLFNTDIHDISTNTNESIYDTFYSPSANDNEYDGKTYNDKFLTSIDFKRNILSYYDEKIYNDKIITSEKEKFSNKKFKNLFKKVSAKFYVDATGDAIIAELLNARMQPDNNKKQAETLRFIMANIDTKAFSEWLLQADTDRDVTSVLYTPNGECYMTTAYTNSPNKHWGLENIFKKAIKNGDLQEEDAAYFQIFGVAKMPGAVAFNCPQVDFSLSCEEKLIKAREMIFRISKFCKKYFPGFENACISHISEDLGVRVSNRPLTVYNYSVTDAIKQSEFENTALHSNYPIDIHSAEDNNDSYDVAKGYNLPVESLISADYNNLFHIGKAIGADFVSQSALRVQKSCFSMGEAVAKYIKGLKNENN